MESIEKDILIHSESEDILSKLKINRNTRQIDTLNSVKTNGKIYFPDREWTEIDSSILNNIINFENNCNARIGQSIRLFKIPQFIEETFEKLNLKDIKNDKDLEDTQLKNSQNFTFAIEQLENYIKINFERNEANFERLGIFTGLNDLESVSFYDDENTYVGMHIDNWDLLPIFERNQSRTLFCINLGLDPRHFIYCNLSLSTIAKKLSEFNKKKDYNSIEPDDLVIEFFKKHPNYPLVRFTLNQYECYITPIQNMIHEGSTLGSKNTDIYYMCLGYFA